MEITERDGNQSISQSRTGQFFPPSRSVPFFPLAAPFRFFPLAAPFRFFIFPNGSVSVFSTVNLSLQKRLLPFVNNLNVRYRTLLLIFKNLHFVNGTLPSTIFFLSIHPRYFLLIYLDKMYKHFKILNLCL